jgi:DNA (cytosine-5)-methyltransferase 1
LPVVKQAHRAWVASPGSLGHFMSIKNAKRSGKKSGAGAPRPVKPIRYIDLFCGIGGFRVAIESVAKARGLTASGVFASDIDAECLKAYEANFRERPSGDITKIDASDVPDHDILLAGFPCQTFSIIGSRKGFEDTRGTLFFDIARILKAKRPQAFVLENVRSLVGHDKGRTFAIIMETLRELGYHSKHKVLNALNFGLPQKRERVFIVGFLDPRALEAFDWPVGNVPMTPLAKILEKNPPQSVYASKQIQENRAAKIREQGTKLPPGPTIWHENVGGHVSPLLYSCALRAGASYNYLLVDGKRRLTPREMLRLQGFPAWYKIECNDYQTRKQAGNSVPVPVVKAVLKKTFDALNWTKVSK